MSAGAPVASAVNVSAPTSSRLVRVTVSEVSVAVSTSLIVASTSSVSVAASPSVRVSSQLGRWVPLLLASRSTTGGSLTAVTLTLKVCGGEVSAPPLAVPPSSISTSVIAAVPLASGAEVKVKVPVADTAGATVNSDGLVLPVTMKVSTWEASLAGPGEIAVAHGVTVCAPASSLTVTSAPWVNEGGWLTWLTVMVKLCGAEVSTPPLAVPPLSCRSSVIVAVPKLFTAGVKVSTPVGEIDGAAEKRPGLVSPVTLKVTV